MVYRGTVPSSWGAGRPAKLVALEVISEGKGEPVVTAEQLKAAEGKRKPAGRGKARRKQGR
jgi:hypothetical protein